MSLSKRIGAYRYNLQPKNLEALSRPSFLPEKRTLLRSCLLPVRRALEGVMLTHRNLVSDCYIAQSNLSYMPPTSFTHFCPPSLLYHARRIHRLFRGAEVVFGKSMAVSRMLKSSAGQDHHASRGALLFNKLRRHHEGNQGRGSRSLRPDEIPQAFPISSKITGKNPGRKFSTQFSTRPVLRRCASRFRAADRSPRACSGCTTNSASTSSRVTA